MADICKDCKHWEETNFIRVHTGRLGKCNRLKITFDRGNRIHELATYANDICLAEFKVDDQYRPAEASELAGHAATYMKGKDTVCATCKHRNTECHGGLSAVPATGKLSCSAYQPEEGPLAAPAIAPVEIRPELRLYAQGNRCSFVPQSDPGKVIPCKFLRSGSYANPRWYCLLFSDKALKSLISCDSATLQDHPATVERCKECLQAESNVCSYC